MKGYIYITGTGVDPWRGKSLADPTFGSPPLLGPCMPNIRAAVVPGDWIFVVSGKLSGVDQYVIGGIEVAEKIHAVEAYDRFPGNRLRTENGAVMGNIIVRCDGSHDPLDWHSDAGFERRARNFIVGSAAVALLSEAEADRGRRGTLGILRRAMERPTAMRVIDVIGSYVSARAASGRHADSMAGPYEK